MQGEITCVPIMITSGKISIQPGHGSKNEVGQAVSTRSATRLDLQQWPKPTVAD